MTAHVVTVCADERRLRGEEHAAALATVMERDQPGALAIPARLAVVDQISLNVSRLALAPVTGDLELCRLAKEQAAFVDVLRQTCIEIARRASIHDSTVYVASQVDPPGRVFSHLCSPVAA